MKKQFSEPKEEQFRQICQQAGLTKKEWVVNDGEEGFTKEGIKKLRDFFIFQGDFGSAWSFNRLLDRKLQWQWKVERG